MKLNISFAVGTLKLIPRFRGTVGQFFMRTQSKKKKKGIEIQSYHILQVSVTIIVVCDQRHRSDQIGIDYGRHCCKTKLFMT